MKLEVKRHKVRSRRLKVLKLDVPPGLPYREQNCQIKCIIEIESIVLKVVSGGISEFF